MNSKLILLLGGILSSLVVFFCLKNQYTIKKPLKKNISQKIVDKKPLKNQKDETSKTDKKVFKAPSLYFKYQEDISLNINKKQKDDFEKFVNFLDNNYSKDIKYKDDIKNAPWVDLAVKSIKYFKDENITDAKIEANSSDIKIYATFTDKKKFDDFTNLLKVTETNNTKLENHIKFKNKVQKVSVVNISNLQNEINSLINKKPLYFKFGSNILTDNSKKTLDDIVRILKSKKIKYDIKVQGHTDAQGNEIYNKKLSQKRADSVRKYLVSHLNNIGKIVSEGFGSAKPKYKNKKDRRNRRVEILIDKGYK